MFCPSRHSEYYSQSSFAQVQNPSQAYRSLYLPCPYDSFHHNSRVDSNPRSHHHPKLSGKGWSVQTCLIVSGPHAFNLDPEFHLHLPLYLSALRLYDTGVVVVVAVSAEQHHMRRRSSVTQSMSWLQPGDLEGLALLPMLHSVREKHLLQHDMSV